MSIVVDPDRQEPEVGSDNSEKIAWGTFHPRRKVFSNRGFKAKRPKTTRGVLELLLHAHFKNLGTRLEFHPTTEGALTGSDFLARHWSNPLPRSDPSSVMP